MYGNTQHDGHPSGGLKPWFDF